MLSLPAAATFGAVTLFTVADSGTQRASAADGSPRSSGQPSGPGRQVRAARTPSQPAPSLREERPGAILWRRSRSIGLPSSGRLVSGVQLPAAGRHFFTWDADLRRSPDRGWRRFGSDRLVRVLLRVISAYAAAHPAAPRVGIGDLSRPRGGDFGPRYTRLAHVSHQNGLDADVYYPRRDRTERAVASRAQINRSLAQDLVDRFVAAGAQKIFVGFSTGLRGPSDVVVPYPNHEDHMHVRFPPPRG